MIFWYFTPKNASAELRTGFLIARLFGMTATAWKSIFIMVAALVSRPAAALSAVLPLEVNLSRTAPLSMINWTTSSEQCAAAVYKGYAGQPANSLTSAPSSSNNLMIASCAVALGRHQSLYTTSWWLSDDLEEMLYIAACRALLHRGRCSIQGVYKERNPSWGVETLSTTALTSPPSRIRNSATSVWSLRAAISRARLSILWRDSLLKNFSTNKRRMSAKPWPEIAVTASWDIVRYFCPE